MALFFVRDYLLRQFLLCTANRFDYSLGIDPILSASIQNTFQIGNRGHGGFVFIRAVHSIGQAYCNPPDKAITKTNNLSVKAGSTNVTTNKGYVGVILLSTGNQGSPSSPSEWLLPAVVWAGKAQL